MDFFSDILIYDFLQRSLFAALFTGILCGIVGVYMVVRRLVFLAGGITHSAFGGLGLAYYLGVNTLWGSLTAGLISAFAVEKMTRNGKIREDSAIGILWSVGMAIGIVFVVLTPGYAPNLMSFLFGNILTVTWADTILIALLLVAVLVVFAVWGRYIIYAALDAEFAASRHLPVRTINGTMLLILSLAIVLSIKVVGIMLLLSLLTIPASISGMLVSDYRKMTVLSSVFSVLGLISGMWISYLVDIPSSAVTVILLAVILLAVKVALALRHRMSCRK